MSTLYITEFVNSGAAYGHTPSTGRWPPIANQTVSIGAGSQTSNPFSSNTNMIRVECDSVCSIMIDFGTPVATDQDARMAANQTEYFTVFPNQVLAVIANV
jgi:hypothetical protein